MNDNGIQGQYIKKIFSLCLLSSEFNSQINLSKLNKSHCTEQRHILT